MDDEVTPIPGLIVKSRIKAIAKMQGKVLSSAFLGLLEQEVYETVIQACHIIGERKIVKVEEFRKYRELLRRCAK